jgi:hypothetical protein
MNYQSISSVLVLIFGLGLFSIQSVNAKNASIKAPNINNFQLITPSSSMKIAQLTEATYPLYGSWRLTFSVNGIVYKGYLIMKGYYGALRVSYFDPNVRKKATIDEVMKLMSSSRGLILLGSNPVYARTSIPHPTYVADNFLFSVQPDGSLAAFTCDYAEQCSSVDVEAVK